MCSVWKVNFSIELLSEAPYIRLTADYHIQHVALAFYFHWFYNKSVSKQSLTRMCEQGCNVRYIRLFACLLTIQYITKHVYLGRRRESNRQPLGDPNGATENTHVPLT